MNDKLWNVKTASLQDTVFSSLKMSTNRQYTHISTGSNIILSQQVWTRPILQRKKCNVDAEIHRHEGKTSFFAVVLRDSLGQFYSGLISFMEDIISPQLAEALALKKAFKDRRKSNVDIEAIVQSVVDALLLGLMRMMGLNWIRLFMIGLSFHLGLIGPYYEL